ncbi:ankyrin repeat domain-containing protein [Candidatus Dependentiae bacterium]|nr:ankyrin repeat domain-containing protein [Candidatus Dependentiae bacterium]
MKNTSNRRCIIIALLLCMSYLVWTMHNDAQEAFVQAAQHDELTQVQKLYQEAISRLSTQKQQELLNRALQAALDPILYPPIACFLLEHGASKSLPSPKQRIQIRSCHCEQLIQTITTEEECHHAITIIKRFMQEENQAIQSKREEQQAQLRQTLQECVDNLFLEAAKKGLLALVQLFFDRSSPIRVDVNVQEGYALSWAAYFDHPAVVEYLMSKGADVHIEQERALGLAFAQGHFDTAITLLQAGATTEKLRTAPSPDTMQRFNQYLHSSVTKRLIEHVTAICPLEQRTRLSFLAHQELLKIPKERTIADQLVQETVRRLYTALQQPSTMQATAPSSPMPQQRTTIYNAGSGNQIALMASPTFTGWVQERNSPITHPLNPAVTITREARQVDGQYAELLRDFMQPQFAQDGRFSSFTIPLDLIPSWWFIDAVEGSFLLDHAQALQCITLWLTGSLVVENPSEALLTAQQQLLDQAYEPKSPPQNPLYKAYELKELTVKRLQATQQ